MGILSHKAVLKVPIDKVWKVLDDFENIYLWHPMVESSNSIGKRKIGIGAMRKIKMYGGREAKERIIGYEKGKYMRLEFLDHGMPAKKMEAQFSTNSVSEYETEVMIAMEQVMKFGIFGELVNRFIMAPMIRKSYIKLLNGLEQHILTGKAIGEDGNPVD